MTESMLGRSPMQHVALVGAVCAAYVGPFAVRADQKSMVFGAAQCEGTYRHHLQGVCTNEKDALYWSFTTTLVKTDRDGKVLKKIPVANHHGDLCYRDGKVYVAVNLGQFNEPAGKADSWVYVYDADTLAELARHKTPEVVHGAGGIDHDDGRFMVVGGLPKGIEVNYVYEYDGDFKFVKRHVIKSGYTLMGIQTAAFASGSWWFGCYGRPQELTKTDRDFKMLGRYVFDCSLGIVGLADGSFLVAQGSVEKDKRRGGRVLVAEPDKKNGLKIRPARKKTGE